MEKMRVQSKNQNFYIHGYSWILRFELRKIMNMTQIQKINFSRCWIENIAFPFLFVLAVVIEKSIENHTEYHLKRHSK